MNLQAVIFDLDGVITDTAEFHFLAWQQLAQSAGMTFSREDNEQLRGVSRRDSLIFILELNGRSEAEDTIQTMMTQKNDMYVEMLNNISPADMLPGVSALLDSLDEASIPFALGSASKNARPVLTRLGILDRFKVIADGNTPVAKKPAPDLFLYAAKELGIHADKCLVIEDAAKGVEAAQAAGMLALAVGPEERFDKLLAHPRTINRPDLAGITAATLQNLEV